MIHTSRPRMRRALVVVGVSAMLFSSCGDKKSSSTGAGSSDAAATEAVATEAASDESEALESTEAVAVTEAAAVAADGDPIEALKDLDSYKMKMVIQSKDITAGMGALGGITMKGTVVLKPEEAADMSVSMGEGDQAMKVRVVEIGGKQYADMGAGLTESSDPSQSSMIDSLRPEKLMAGLTSTSSKMKSVGDEKKNGVDCKHLVATADTIKEMGSQLGSTFGLPDATWSMSAWVAKEGNYMVSWVMKGTSNASDKGEFMMSLDISDINSSSNVVKGP